MKLKEPWNEEVKQCETKAKAIQTHILWNGCKRLLLLLLGFTLGYLLANINKLSEWNRILGLASHKDPFPHFPLSATKWFVFDVNVSGFSHKERKKMSNDFAFAAAARWSKIFWFYSHYRGSEWVSVRPSTYIRLCVCVYFTAARVLFNFKRFVIPDERLSSSLEQKTNEIFRLNRYLDLWLNVCSEIKMSDMEWGRKKSAGQASQSRGSRLIKRPLLYSNASYIASVT